MISGRMFRFSDGDPTVRLYGGKNKHLRLHQKYKNVAKGVNSTCTVLMDQVPFYLTVSEYFSSRMSLFFNTNQMEYDTNIVH